jgi:hypothetical protein
MAAIAERRETLRSSRALGALRRWWPLPVIWVLVLVYFWPTICSFPFGAAFMVRGDFTQQFYPLHYFAGNEWWHGRVPLWNPYIAAGYPYQADVQTAVFYPLNLFVSFLTGWHGLPFVALEWQLALDYALGATFAFLFARQLTGNVMAAMISGIAFALSGFLTSYPMQQMPILESAVWLPLILFFIERAVGQTGRWRTINFALAGVAVGISILGGHPQTCMYIAYLVLAYFLYRAIGGRLPWRSIVFGLAMVACVGFAIAAVQVLPTLEFFRLSTRGGALDYAMASSGYTLDSMPGLLLDGWMRETALYIGAPALVLALAAWLRPRGQVFFWSATVVVALLVSLGGHGFLYPLLFTVAPGFSLFQDQERVMIVFSMAISILCALGCQSLIDLRSGVRGWGLGPRGQGKSVTPSGFRVRHGLALVAAPLVAVAIGACLAWNRSPGIDMSVPVWSSWVRLALLVVVCLVGVLLWLHSRRPFALLGSALALLVALDLFAVNFGNNLSPVNPLPSADLMAAVGALRDHPEPYRIMSENSAVLPANYGMIAQSPHVLSDTPFALARTQALLQNLDWKMTRLFNVKFLLTRQSPMENYDFVRSVGDVSVYFVKLSMPRVWVVNDVRVAADEQQALALTREPTLDPGTYVVLEQQPTLALDPQQKVDQKWRITANSPRWFRAEVETAANGVFVISDAYYPGWQAYIDGHEVALLRADYAFRAVELPVGAHVIELHYRPLTFWAGLAVSFLAVVFVVILVFGPGLAARFRRRPANG